MRLSGVHWGVLVKPSNTHSITFTCQIRSIHVPDQCSALNALLGNLIGPSQASNDFVMTSTPIPSKENVYKWTRREGEGGCAGIFGWWFWLLRYLDRLLNSCIMRATQAKATGKIQMKGCRAVI